MNKDKKIEMQEKIIHRLEKENESLLEQNKELQNTVNENQRIIEEAEKCIELCNKELSSIATLKETYLKAIEDISKYKKELKKEMNGLLKTVKKNI